MTLEAAAGNELAATGQDDTARLRRLDPAAVAAAVERYRNRLYRYLYRLVRDSATAEDVFQQTWLNAVRRIAQYDGRSAFDSWLFSIAHNAAMDRLRRQGPEPPEAVAISAPLAPDGFAATLGGERAAVLDQAMAGLAPVYREALTLRFEEGLKIEEIAAITGAPVSTVKSRLHRALEGVRQAMAGRWRKEDLL
jgi:RNA polymerase sigma-70 factor, ECF subfamily